MNTMRFTWFAGAVMAFCALGSAADYPGYSLVDSKFVPSDDSVVTSIPLESGVTYLVEASGTWVFDVGVPGSLADARWIIAGPDWSAWWDTRVDTNLGPNPLGLWLDSSNDSMWGDFSLSHVYTANVLGSGIPVSFHIFDEFPNSNQKAYGDNGGGLSVRIFTPVPEPTAAAGAALAAFFALMRRSRRVSAKA